MLQALKVLKRVEPPIQNLTSVYNMRLQTIWPNASSSTGCMIEHSPHHFLHSPSSEPATQAWYTLATSEAPCLFPSLEVHQQPGLQQSNCKCPGVGHQIRFICGRQINNAPASAITPKCKRFGVNQTFASMRVMFRTCRIQHYAHVMCLTKKQVEVVVDSRENLSKV